MELIPVDGIGEVVASDDLAQLLTDQVRLRTRDVVVITSKVVAKAEGLTTLEDPERLLDEETDRVVATMGPVRIVRTHHGLTLANAGIDRSNLEHGTAIPLPRQPDASARAIRRRVHELTGHVVGIVIADTAGRAWRTGQTDIAIGCAGVVPSMSFSGRTDAYGNPLAVTDPAVADELAGAAELVSGKLGGRPFVVVRGLDPALLLEDDGPGAEALLRPEGQDFFGLGTRDAVLAAALRGSRRGFPDPREEDWSVIDAVLAGSDLPSHRDGRTVTIRLGARSFDAGALTERVTAVAFAHDLRVDVVVTD